MSAKKPACYAILQFRMPTDLHKLLGSAVRPSAETGALLFRGWDQQGHFCIPTWLNDGLTGPYAGSLCEPRFLWLQGYRRFCIQVVASEVFRRGKIDTSLYPLVLVAGRTIMCSSHAAEPNVVSFHNEVVGTFMAIGSLIAYN
jgi:hypothetical protein